MNKTELKKLMPEAHPWDLYGLEFFKERAKHGHHCQIERLISRGFPFIKHLLCLPLKDRQALIFSHRPTLRPGLREALEASFPSRRVFKTERENCNAGIKLQFNGDSPNNRNEGWLRACIYKPSPSYNKPNNGVLRDEGYIFWDSKWLHRLGRIDKPWEIEVAECGFPTRYRERSRKPSAEERLEGVEIDHSFMLPLAAHPTRRKDEHKLIGDIY